MTQKKHLEKTGKTSRMDDIPKWIFILIGFPFLIWIWIVALPLWIRARLKNWTQEND